MLFDLTGRCAFANAAAAELVGQHHDWFLGRPYDQILAPQVRDAFHAAFANVLSGASRVEVVALENEHWPRLGSAAGRVQRVGEHLLLVMRRTAAEARRAHAAQGLGTTLDWAATLQGIAQAALGSFADWCALDVLGPDGMLRRVVATNEDSQQAAAERLAALGMVEGSFIRRVVRTGRPKGVPDAHATRDLELIVNEEPPAANLSRGHYLEAGVAAWFADQHPDWTVRPGGCWAHRDEPLFTASPDRELELPGGEVRGLELKTAADADEWGEPGTDEIPVGYKAQVQWQMLVRGTRITHVAVLSAYLEFREYVVEYDPENADLLATAAREFLDTLPGGPAEQRPNLDSHAATYQAVRQMHPDIYDVDVELDADLAREFCLARAAKAAADSRATAAAAAVADVLGDGRRARFLNQTIAQRQAKGDGIPYLVAGRSLPTFED